MTSLTVTTKKSRRLRHGVSLLAMTWLLACVSTGLWLIVGAGQPAIHQPTSAAARHYFTKNIEDVQVGDYVLAKDPGDGGVPTPHRVIALPRNWTERVVHVRVRGDAEIQATRMHPFWVQGKGWTDAVDLKPGDRLRDEKDQLVSVLGATVESRTTGTFNLTVEGVHTFYVMAGKTPVLVHNVNVYPDPAPPGYPNGASNLDHIRARSLGGSDGRSNLQSLPSETNFRKGGYEGQLGRDWQAYRDAGLTDEQIEEILGPEINSLGNSPPPRPMDPNQLDTLPCR